MIVVTHASILVTNIFDVNNVKLSIGSLGPHRCRFESHMGQKLLQIRQAMKLAVGISACGSLHICVHA